MYLYSKKNVPECAEVNHNLLAISGLFGIAT
jgi:hypothetical protein